MNVYVCLDARVMKLLPHVIVISVTIKLFNNKECAAAAGVLVPVKYILIVTFGSIKLV